LCVSFWSFWSFCHVSRCFKMLILWLSHVSPLKPAVDFVQTPQVPWLGAGLWLRGLNCITAPSRRVNFWESQRNKCLIKIDGFVWKWNIPKSHGLSLSSSSSSSSS
jgi:hypothetical protein